MKKLFRIDYLLIVLVFGFFLFQFIREGRQEKLLETSIKHMGVVRKIYFNTAVHGSAYAMISYKLGPNEFSFKQIGDFRKLEIGDTVLIEYSKKDHSVAKVVDKYYMRKYQYLKED